MERTTEVRDARKTIRGLVQGMIYRNCGIDYVQQLASLGFETNIVIKIRREDYPGFFVSEWFPIYHHVNPPAVLQISEYDLDFFNRSGILPPNTATELGKTREGTILLLLSSSLRSIFVTNQKGIEAMQLLRKFGLGVRITVIITQKIKPRQKANIFEYVQTSLNDFRATPDDRMFLKHISLLFNSKGGAK